MFRSLMPLGRFSADDPFTSLQREMNRLFEDAFSAVPAVTSNGKAFLSPSVDVKESDKAVEVTAELPGIDEKDVEVSFENDILTLKGAKKAEKTEAKEGYRLSERSYGMFERSWQVPGIDSDKITAIVNKGVLKVMLPKRADAKPSVKKIEIKPAA